MPFFFGRYLFSLISHFCFVHVPLWLHISQFLKNTLPVQAGVHHFVLVRITADVHNYCANWLVMGCTSSISPDVFCGLMFAHIYPPYEHR
jgi:hypothetical protein